MRLIGAGPLRWSLIAMAALIAGCSTPAMTETAHPPDFSLVLTLYGGDAPADSLAAEGLAAEPGHYVLLPNRWLHAARGPDVYHDHFPGQTARLTPEQMSAIYYWLAEHDWLTPPEQVVQVDEPGAGMMELTVTADGQQSRYVIDSREAPEAMELYELVDAHTRSN